MFERLFLVLSFRSSSSLAVYLLLGAAGLFAGLTAGEFGGQAGTRERASAASVEHGRLLAGQYCQSCHALPDPASLDAKTWEGGVLPSMGPRLGVYGHGSVRYDVPTPDRLPDPNFFPTEPLLSAGQWQNIVDYYVGTSPASLPPQSRQHAIRLGLPQFSAEAPRLAYPQPAVTLVKMVEVGPHGRLIVSDVGRRQAWVFAADLEPLGAVPTDGGIVDVEVIGGGEAVVVANMGQMHPTDEPFGKVQAFGVDAAGQLAAGPAELFAGLRRPVQVSAADLNADGERDFLVCEFGYLAGGLTWMEGVGGGKFRRHELSTMPGPVRSYVDDHNGDGLPVVWALFGQGREGVFLFTNKGGGRFEQEQVLEFPPVFGSSYFELADFNTDGYPDILYTCGDNGDSSPVLKPYHGAYVFMNDGRNRFAQRYFFPINGCVKAMARDFDGDGDLDLATISFFADYPNQPEEGFVYLENVGGLDFRPGSTEAAKRGRWLTMDAGDIDRDGDVDLVLGNCSVMPAISRSTYDWTAGPPFLLLRNNHVKAAP